MSTKNEPLSEPRPDGDGYIETVRMCVEYERTVKIGGKGGRTGRGGRREKREEEGKKEDSDDDDESFVSG